MFLDHFGTIIVDIEVLQSSSISIEGNKLKLDKSSLGGGNGELLQWQRISLLPAVIY